MELNQEEREMIANQMFLEKQNAAFLLSVPGFSELSEDLRMEFLKETKLIAETMGLRTEQGIVSYALAVWWLGIDFVELSKELESLLKSGYPEVRKVYAMNEWVNSMIGEPDNVAAADEKLKQGLTRTEPWGK